MESARVVVPAILEGRIRLTFSQAVGILWPYFRAKILEQVRALLPVAACLFAFQIVILRMPIPGAVAISASLACAILGLMLFMEGLRLWLLPLGEMIGGGLPRRSSLPVIAGFALLLGAGATLAEPALGGLKMAGAGLDPRQAPLLDALLNRNAVALAACVALGVGVAVVLGTLRFLFGWSLKILLVPAVILAGGMTAWAHADPALRSAIGVAWDFGAVIVGPITVPLVLGLGIGVCKSTGRSDTGMSGFGAVTLISIFPIFSTLALAFFLHAAGGAEAGVPAASAEAAWLPGLLGGAAVEAIIASSQAILPLSIFLFLVQIFVLRERLAQRDEIALGLSFALLGLILFNLGLLQGLTPLGDQVGNTIPAAFSRIAIGSPPEPFGPLYGSIMGPVIVIGFAFVLGYAATLAEPALNALGIQVEEITVGAFRKRLLVHAVSAGVAGGMALGIARIVFQIPLALLILPVYALLLLLTIISTEEFASIGWDSGAATTGPITVPIVVAMGLGIGRNLPGMPDGFGILALASAGPIMTIMVLGLVMRRSSGAAAKG